MGRELWDKYWVRQLALVIGYVITYLSIRDFSTSSWPITTPLRFACLLFLPYRYWPLFAGVDCVAQSYVAYECVDRFGILWSLTQLVPYSAISMPLVWWCREKLNLFPSTQLVNFKALLICTVAVSLAWDAQAVLSGACGQVNGHWFVIPFIDVPEGFLGRYITIVALMPWVLMVRAEYLSEEPWQRRLRKAAKELLAVDTLALLLSTALFVYWLYLHSEEEARKLSYLAAFLPIAWLTLKPGWRAAALGGTPAILCVASLLQYDTAELNIETEAFIAFVVTCLFTLGARITAQSLKEEQDRLEVEQALQLARQSFQLSETRIKKTAQALQVAGTSLQLTQHQLLDRVHDVLPESEVQRYYRQAASMQDHVNRLVDSMYPSAWRQRGLSAALHETIADALREAAINYRCRIRGPLDDLTPAIHAAIYRLACESVMHINGQLVCSSIRLGVRSGATANGYWVALQVEGKLDNSHINDAMFDTTERDMLGSRLGAYGLGLLALRNHARLFGGELRSKVTENGLRLSYMLVDVINRPMEQLTAPQPWTA
ncbi:hypothetical protein EKH79_10995 [Dyella dinghuensis]|uniref:MASE1 domain-containing protein n=1 Tax=Dyella dinghuensis TaxID=1920169 RepID=A0A432LU63_9GAMM|nr:hypothetical protein [Dyella dinghuensis]RUL64545.1 hypothetical protein EKH79_10995 [Dyella dinghuensis]